MRYLPRTQQKSPATSYGIRAFQHNEVIMTQKHEIKNRWTGEVLFSCEIPEGMESGMIARYAAETAISEGADLRGANLRDAKNAPLVINGLYWLVVIDGLGMMRIGCQNHSIERWASFSDELINRMDSCALEFWKQHKEMLMGICNTYKHKAEEQES